MKLAFWYILSVLSGVLLFASMAEMVRCIEWSYLTRNYNMGISIFFSDAKEYGEEYLTLAEISLPIALVSIFMLRPLVRQITKDEWYKIGLITAVLIAPIITIVGLSWNHRY